MKMENRRVLIVEDQEADRMLLSAYLQRNGCQLLYAHDGLEGVEKARVWQPDIILMDSEMPRCSGHDACKIITQDPRTRDIPVFFFPVLPPPNHAIEGYLPAPVANKINPSNLKKVNCRSANN